MKKKLILISVSIKKPYRNRYGSFFFVRLSDKETTGCAGENKEL